MVANALRQQRNPRSAKLDTARAVRPYSLTDPRCLPPVTIMIRERCAAFC
jgi:hypothetical protein